MTSIACFFGGGWPWPASRGCALRDRERLPDVCILNGELIAFGILERGVLLDEVDAPDGAIVEVMVAEAIDTSAISRFD